MVAKKKPGPPSKTRDLMAEWLYDRLKDGFPVQAAQIYDDCGEAFQYQKPNPLGIKDEKGWWSKTRVLRKVAETDLPELPYPRKGKCVHAYQGSDNRWYWRLVDNQPESEEKTDAPD